VLGLLVPERCCAGVEGPLHQSYRRDLVLLDGIFLLLRLVALLEERHLIVRTEVLVRLQYGANADSHIYQYTLIIYL
jgi:hypothetical protein